MWCIRPDSANSLVRPSQVLCGLLPRTRKTYIEGRASAVSQDLAHGHFFLVHSLASIFLLCRQTAFSIGGFLPPTASATQFTMTQRLRPPAPRKSAGGRSVLLTADGHPCPLETSLYVSAHSPIVPDGGANRHKGYSALRITGSPNMALRWVLLI